MPTTSTPLRLPPGRLQTAATGTLKVVAAVGAVLLVDVLPLPTLFVVVVTVIALRLLLLPL